MSEMDEKYMRRCFELAANGLGTTYPNPLVGSVIIRDGKVISEGWHRAAGEPHAERMAILRTKNPDDLCGATLYVNLEPCSHYGKTPPCANLIVESGIGRVVISNGDPNPLVSGRGIRILMDAGIEVRSQVLEEEGAFLNRRFFHFHTVKKPYIILKWAESSDGFIGGIKDEKPVAVKISGMDSSRWVHRWRSEEYGIAVGKNTAVIDNPILDTRHWRGNNPRPVIFSFRSKIDSKVRLKNEETVFYDDLGFDPKDGNPDLGLIFSKLYEKQFQSILIEGGTALLQSCIDRGYWNEIRRFTSFKKQLKTGIKAPDISGLVSQSIVENPDDILQIYFRKP